MFCISTSRRSQVPTVLDIPAKTLAGTAASDDSMPTDLVAGAARPVPRDWRVLGEVIKLRDRPRCQSPLAKRGDADHDAESRGAE